MITEYIVTPVAFSIMRLDVMHEGARDKTTAGPSTCATRVALSVFCYCNINKSHGDTPYGGGDIEVGGHKRARTWETQMFLRAASAACADDAARRQNSEQRDRRQASMNHHRITITITIITCLL